MADHVSAFVKDLAPMAVAIGDQYGIDPILIITQAAIESGWGSEVAGNNYFGVKSHGQPGGQQVSTHEEINGQMVPVVDSFRKYDSLQSSMVDYARFLQSNPRYQEVFKAGDLDGQIKAIGASGYATDSNYPTLLSQVSKMVKRAMPPIPPGSLPTVGTLTDTIPRKAPLPVTPSPNLAGLRKSAAQDNLVAGSFAKLPKNTSYLSDQLGMSPIMGGKQQAPMFDAGFDTTMNAMRLFNTPMDTQGMFTAKSAPKPAQMSPAVAGTRAINDTFAGLAGTPPLKLAPKPATKSPGLAGTQFINSTFAKLPTSPIGQPPTTKAVATVPVAGVPMPKPRPNTTKVVASLPTTTPTYAIDPGLQAALNAQKPVLPKPAAASAQNPYAYLFQNGPKAKPVVKPTFTAAAQPNGSINPNKDQAQLPAHVYPQGEGGIQPWQVAQIGLPASGIKPPKLAPVPFAKPKAFGSPTVAVGTVLDVIPKVAPKPFPKPNFGMGGPDIDPPKPLPRPKPINPYVEPPPGPLSGILNALINAMPGGGLFGPANKPAGPSIPSAYWNMITGQSDGMDGGGGPSSLATTGGTGPAADSAWHGRYGGGNRTI